MATTKQVPQDEWKSYFERFAKQHLVAGPREAGSVEIVSPVLGVELEASAMILEGLAYDPKSHAFEVWLEDLDHLVFDPAEIWVIEEDDGFVSTIELVTADGGKEIIYLQRGDAAASLDAPGAPPQP
jgi:hypothetical protein